MGTRAHYSISVGSLPNFDQVRFRDPEPRAIAPSKPGGALALTASPGTSLPILPSSSTEAGSASGTLNKSFHKKVRSS